MLIAVMSDSHDRWDYLDKAINIAVEKEASELLFAGDFMSPPGIEVLRKFPGKITMVWGNNDGEKIGLLSKANETGHIKIVGDLFEGTLDGTSVFMHHYPRPAEIAVQSGLYKIVVHGHTHEFRSDRIKGVLLLNPGEIQGIMSGISTFALVNTNTLSVEKIIVESI